jgi:hypothetical protein
MILCQFTYFLETFLVLLSLFYNKVASISLAFSYKTIKFFVNLQDVGQNGTYTPKYSFFEFLNLIRGTYRSIWNYFPQTHKNSYK